MKLKKTLLIFLFGLIVGVGVSPLASKKPQEIWDSPVSLTMARTQDFHSPVWEGEVLGMMADSNLQPRKTFGDIMADSNQQEEVSSKTQDQQEVFVKEVIEKEEKKPLLESKDEDQLVRSEEEEAESEQEKTINQKSGSMTIAVLGDSMVDTMGEHLPYLDRALKEYYPNYFFNLLNYGAGATNIEYGIYRLTNDHQYLDEPVPSLISTNPDIVIVESFAYNPWGGEKSDLDRHWLAMAKVVDILKAQTKAKILFLSTIAPNKANFGAGPAGVNWGKDQAWEHAEKISKYLENTLAFASSQNISVVDAYHPSIVGGHGNLELINPGDHIHPSVAGCQFVADLIAKKLVSLGWVN